MKARTNGIEMYYEVLGEGKPIVLLHGLGLDHSIWKEVVNAYSNQAKFIVPDLRGHGNSQTGDGDGTIEQFADDVLALIDLLGFEKVSLAGHSMGGYISLAFAEKHPERVGNLVMVTSNARADDEEKHKSRLSDADKVLNVGSVILAEGLAPKLSKDLDIQRLSYEIIANTAPEGVSNVLRAIAFRPSRLNVLEKLDAKVLAIAGDEDQLMKPEVAFEIAECANNGKAVVLPGVGHMPMMEASLALGALLISLL
jgi:pimeloyl-ACP methyl ester carboxylesterase